VAEVAARPTVALTFDDGPHLKNTAFILDELRRRGAKATFFVTGPNARRHPEIIRRMAAEGHEIGNHSWGHPYLPKLSDAAVRREIAKTQAVVKEIVGREPKIFRPPFGAFRPRVGRAAGLPAIIWSVDTLDWLHRNSDRIIRVATKAKDGDIVLMHDTHATTARAVGRVLDELGSNGFRFVTVSQILGFDKSPQKAVPGKSYHDARHQAP
jgi:peptidoglycan/xylan/chitin deacetylase (PgdA/CDA1 family)